MRRSSANWGFSTRPAWLTVKLCPYLAAWRRWIQEPAHHSLRQSSAWRLVSLALGHIGVVSLLVHHSCWLPETLWRWTRKHSSTLRRWFARGVAPALDRAWRQRRVLGLSILHTVRFDYSSSDFPLNHMIYGRGVDPADARWWGLARHGHDPCPGGRTRRHRGDASGLHLLRFRLWNASPLHGVLHPPLMRHMLLVLPQIWCLFSTYLECDHFTVHQGDSCCVGGPACCVAQRRPKEFLSRWSKQHQKCIPKSPILVASPPLRPRSLGFLG